MARPITVADDTHRLEQQDYREDLVEKREPEVNRADTAVVVTVYGLMRDIAVKDRRRGRKSLSEFMDKAAAVLEAQGFDRERSLRVLRRRLVRPPDRFHSLLGIEDEDGHGNLP